MKNSKVTVNRSTQTDPLLIPYVLLNNIFDNKVNSPDKAFKLPPQVRQKKFKDASNQSLVSQVPYTYRLFTKAISNDNLANSTIVSSSGNVFNINKRRGPRKTKCHKPKQNILEDIYDNDMNIPIMLSEPTNVSKREENISPNNGLDINNDQPCPNLNDMQFLDLDSYLEEEHQEEKSCILSVRDTAIQTSAPNDKTENPLTGGNEEKNKSKNESDNMSQEKMFRIEAKNVNVHIHNHFN